MSESGPRSDVGTDGEKYELVVELKSSLERRRAGAMRMISRTGRGTPNGTRRCLMMTGSARHGTGLRIKGSLDHPTLQKRPQMEEESSSFKVLSVEVLQRTRPADQRGPFRGQQQQVMQLGRIFHYDAPRDESAVRPPNHELP